MEVSLHTTLWLGWAFACALGVRLGFTRLFRAQLGRMAQLASYGMWLVLPLVGWATVFLAGYVQQVGVSDPHQMWGYWLFFYSPLGLPTIFGAPAVLFVDLVKAMIDRRRPRQNA